MKWALNPIKKLLVMPMTPVPFCASGHVLPERPLSWLRGSQLGRLMVTFPSGSMWSTFQHHESSPGGIKLPSHYQFNSSTFYASSECYL